MINMPARTLRDQQETVTSRLAGVCTWSAISHPVVSYTTQIRHRSRRLACLS